MLPLACLVPPICVCWDVAGKLRPHLFIEAQGNLHVLLNAISDVLTDKRFELPLEKAQKACLSAKKLIDCSKRQAKQSILPHIHKRAVKWHTLKERM